MTKKKKILPLRKYQSLSFKVEETVLQTPAKSMPTNLAEEKEKFLKSGKTPQFHIQDPSKLAELANKTRNQIRFDLLGEAEHILQTVRDQYGAGEYFLEHAYGYRITKEEATPMLLKYIEENHLTESIKIHWCDNLACSAKMVWTGPTVHANKPELRRYSLWISGSDENNYMRESGIKCLMDHEIGTHFPWFSDRARFGLRSLGAFEGQCTEEGLAAINTALRGRVKLLWSAALAYYTACKAAEMTFKELFDHIGRFISNPDYRWKQVMRVKRGLTNPNDLGGFGNDQCYFEGAVTILRNMDNIDFYLLMSGKVCYDELDRIKRVVRRDVVKFPVFMKNMNAYLRTLRKMASLNNLQVNHPQRSPPTAYLRRLDERRAEACGRKIKKVRPYNKLHRNAFGKGRMSDRKGKAEQQQDQTEEVKSFAVSEKFVNFHQQRKMEVKKREEEDKMLSLVNSLTIQIQSMDESLDEKLVHLKDIVQGHSWSSEDYRENLLSQASDELSGNNFGDEMKIEPENKEESIAEEAAATVSNQPGPLDADDEKESIASSERAGSITQERPWTEGTRSVSSLRKELTRAKHSLRGLQDNANTESLPNLPLADRQKGARSKSTNFLLSKHPAEPWILRPNAQVPSESSGEFPGKKGDIFNNKRMNLQKQKQLLHPSIARLTTRENITGIKPRLQERLRVIERVILNNKGENAIVPFRLGTSDELTVDVPNDNSECSQAYGEGNFDWKGTPNRDEVGGSVAAHADQRHEACLESEMTVNNPVFGSALIHQRPQSVQLPMPSHARSQGKSKASLSRSEDRGNQRMDTVKAETNSEISTFCTISAVNGLPEGCEVE